MNSRTPLGYLLKEALLILAFAYLVLIGATSNGIVNYDLTRFSVSIFTAIVILWLAVRLQSGRKMQSEVIPQAAAPPLGRPLALFLAAYWLASLTSIDPRRSLGEAWLVGLYVFVFALTVELVERGWPRELFVKALLLTGAVVLGLGVYLALEWYRAWLAAAPGEWLPTLTYRLPAPNTVAIFLNLLLMAALARLFGTRARVPRFFLTLWITGALGLIFLTSSRSGWLGTAAGVVTTVGLSLSASNTGVSSRALWHWLRRRWALLIVLSVMGVAALGLLSWAAYRQIEHPTHGPILSARSEFWSPAWTTFLQSPWVGQGPFTFGSAYLRANSVPPSLLFIHAHSLFFNLLAETGLVGVLTLGISVLAVFLALWRQVNVLRDEDRAVAVGVFAALTAFAVHGIFETVSAEPSNAFVVAILLGAALAPGSESAAPAPRAARRWPVAALALALVVAGWYGLWLSAFLHLGVTAANKSDWPRAEALFAETTRRDPRSAVAHQQLGLAKSARVAEGKTETLAGAIAAFEMAVRLDPDWALNHANLGALYAAQGQTEAALKESRAAVELAPNTPTYPLNLGRVAEEAGLLDEARAAYSATLTLRPDWADAYFWRATPFRVVVAAEWRKSNPVADALTTEELEAVIAGGDPFAITHAQLAEAYLSEGRIEEAARLLKRAELAYFRSGEDALEVLWAKTELAAAQGDYAAAVKLGEQVVAGHRDQSIFGPGTFGDPSYGPFFQRRETMAMDLAPQLTLIHFTDRWATRLVLLGDWHAALGDAARATAVYRDVLTYVPDNIEAQARLK